MKDNNMQKNAADYSREFDGTPRAAVELSGRVVYICHVPKLKRMDFRKKVQCLMEETEGNEALATLKLVDLLIETFGWKIESTSTHGKQQWVDSEGEVHEDDKLVETLIQCRGYKAVIRRICNPDGSLEVQLDKATSMYIKQSIDDVRRWTQDDHDAAVKAAEKHNAWKQAVAKKKAWEKDNVGKFSIAAAFGCIEVKEDSSEDSSEKGE